MHHHDDNDEWGRWRVIGWRFRIRRASAEYRSDDVPDPTDGCGGLRDHAADLGTREHDHDESQRFGGAGAAVGPGLLQHDDDEHNRGPSRISPEDPGAEHRSDDHGPDDPTDDCGGLRDRATDLGTREHDHDEYQRFGGAGTSVGPGLLQHDDHQHGGQSRASPEELDERGQAGRGRYVGTRSGRR